MENHVNECENDNSRSAWGVLGGLMVGGLIGAGTMLLLAPQSGKKTRAQIQEISIDLRGQTTTAVKDIAALAGIQSRKTRAEVRKYSKQLEKRSQAVFDGQKRRWLSFVKAGGIAIQDSLT